MAPIARTQQGSWHWSRRIYLLLAAGLAWELVRVVLGAAYSPLGYAEALIGPVCHRLPERTVSFGESALPVCARCTGIWMGWLLVLPLWLFTSAGSRPRRRLKRSRAWVAVGALVAVLLASLEAMGWLTTQNPTRLALGVPIGALAGLLLRGGFFPGSTEVET